MKAIDKFKKKLKLKKNKDNKLKKNIFKNYLHRQMFTDRMKNK